MMVRKGNEKYDDLSHKVIIAPLCNGIKVESAKMFFTDISVMILHHFAKDREA